MKGCLNFLIIIAIIGVLYNCIENRGASDSKNKNLKSGKYSGSYSKNANYNKALRSGKPIFIFYDMKYCKNCQNFKPVYNRIKSKYQGRYYFLVYTFQGFKASMKIEPNDPFGNVQRSCHPYVTCLIDPSRDKVYPDEMRNMDFATLDKIMADFLK